MITVKSFEVNCFSQNTYIVSDETKEAILIDCGCMFQKERDELSSYVTEQGLTLKRFICTHLHLDHICGSEFIYKTYGLKPEAHKADVEGLPSLAEQARAFGIPPSFKGVPVEHFIYGGEVIPFGKTNVVALLVPGHSPGGLAFYNEQERFVMTGDSLFAGSIGRTDLWDGDEEMLKAAIRDKLFALPEDTTVYPGHGAETNILDEKMNNIYI